MIAALCLLAVLVVVLLRPIVEAYRDWHRDARLAEHIARIGYDAQHGAVERISMRDANERRR